MFSLHRLNIACVGGATTSMVAFQAISPGSTLGRRKLFYSEDRTHDLKIMRLTRCLLRHRGGTHDLEIMRLTRCLLRHRGGMNSSKI